MQLSTDKLQLIKNAIHNKQIFTDIIKSSASVMQYINILVGSLETSHVNLFVRLSTSTMCLK